MACASPQAGNHHALFDIEALLEELCQLLEQAQLSLERIFLNADSGFDAKALREACFRRDSEATIVSNPRSGRGEMAENNYFAKELYRQRTAIEHTNAWLDGFKTLLVRYNASIETWLTFHWLAFAVSLLRKIPLDTKP